MGAQVVELGPVNATIHKVNECVRIADLQKLTDMYQNLKSSLRLTMTPEHLTGQTDTHLISVMVGQKRFEGIRK